MAFSIVVRDGPWLHRNTKTGSIQVYNLDYDQMTLAGAISQFAPVSGVPLNQVNIMSTLPAASCAAQQIRNSCMIKTHPIVKIANSYNVFEEMCGRGGIPFVSIDSLCAL